MSQVVTGEAVQIDLRIARLGTRSIAATIDLATEFIGLGLTLFGAYAIFNPSDAASQAAITLVVAVGWLLGYPVAFETLMRGRTPGKMAMGLRVTRDDGGPPRFRHCLVRGLLGVFIEKPGAFYFVPAVFSMLLSEHAKRLGDLFAGTVVVQERVPKMVIMPPVMPPPLAQWATTLDLAALDDPLALAARQFLGRATRLAPGARDRLSSEIVGAVAAAVTPPPPPGTPGWAYLSAVLAERTRRARGHLVAVTPSLYAQVPSWVAAAAPVPAVPVGSTGPVQAAPLPATSVPAAPAPALTSPFAQPG